mgnify:FL=1
MNEILKYDQDFSESKFITYVNNVFIQIYTALMTKEIENIKHFVTDDVYEQLKQKVDILNQKGLIQMYDELNVARTDILHYQIEDHQMIIQVMILSRYLDYLIDLEGNYVSGNRDSRVSRNNYLTFMKKIDFQTVGTVNKCPGCGASIDVNASGICPYCGTVYNQEDKNWILSSMKME